MAEHQLSKELVRRITWRIAPLPILMYFICILDRANLGYAAITMNKELGLTAAQYGLAAGLLYSTYVLLEVPSNMQLQKTSPKIWFTRIMVTWGLCSAAMGFVQSANQLYVARMFLGAAEAGLFPGLLYYLTRWLPKAQRVSITALFMTAAPVAFVFGGPISGFLIDHATIAGHSGWRAMLMIEGLVTVLVGVMLPFLLPNKPDEAKWLSAQEKSAIAEALRSESGAPDGHHRLSDALKDVKVWALGFVFFGINTTFSILFWFLPQIVAGFKTGGGSYSAFEIGVISAAPFGCAAIVMVIFGFWLKGRSTVTWHLGLPLALAALGTVMPALFSDPAMAMLGLCIAASGSFSAMVSFWQFPPMVLREKTLASGIAMIAAVGVSSAIVVPWINGYIKDVTGSLSNAMIFNGVVIFASLTAAVVIGQRITRTNEMSALGARA